MTVNINLDVNMIIQLIQQLPEDQKLLIKKEIDKSFFNSEPPGETDEITQLILNGPVMTEDEEERFSRISNGFKH